MREKKPPITDDILPEELCGKDEEQRRQLAIAEHEQGGTSLREVCRRFFVSEATVCSRLKGVPSRAEAAVDRRTLSPTETRILADWCKKMAARYAPLTREQVLFEATRLLHNTSPAAKAEGRIMSKSWYYDTFLKGHDDLKITKTRGLDRTKTMFASVATAERWFQDLAEKVEEYKIEPANIWNMDEKGFMIGVVKGAAHVVVDREQPDTHFEQDGDRQWVTIIESMSAGGRLGPLVVLFKGKQMQTVWARDFPDDAAVGVTPKGWSNNEEGFKWAKKFVKGTQPADPEQWRLLFMDQHSSHIQWPTLQYLEDNKVLPFLFIQNSTHVAQPLDVSMFAPLAKAYEKQVRIQSMQGTRVNKQEFAKYFMASRNETFKPDRIKHAFVVTGLCPVNFHRSQVFKELNSKAEARSKRTLIQRITEGSEVTAVGASGASGEATAAAVSVPNGEGPAVDAAQPGGADPPGNVESGRQDEGEDRANDPSLDAHSIASTAPSSSSLQVPTAISLLSSHPSPLLSSSSSSLGSIAASSSSSSLRPSDSASQQASRATKSSMLSPEDRARATDEVARGLLSGGNATPLVQLHSFADRIIRAWRGDQDPGRKVMLDVIRRYMDASRALEAQFSLDQRDLDTLRQKLANKSKLKAKKGVVVNVTGAMEKSRIKELEEAALAKELEEEARRIKVAETKERSKEKKRQREAEKKSKAEATQKKKEAKEAEKREKEAAQRRKAASQWLDGQVASTKRKGNGGQHRKKAGARGVATEQTQDGPDDEEEETMELTRPQGPARHARRAAAPAVPAEVAIAGSVTSDKPGPPQKTARGGRGTDSTRRNHEGEADEDEDKDEDEDEDEDEDDKWPGEEEEEEESEAEGRERTARQAGRKVVGAALSRQADVSAPAKIVLWPTSRRTANAEDEDEGEGGGDDDSDDEDDPCIDDGEGSVDDEAEDLADPPFDPFEDLESFTEALNAIDDDDDDDDDEEPSNTPVLAGASSRGPGNSADVGHKHASSGIIADNTSVTHPPSIASTSTARPDTATPDFNVLPPLRSRTGRTYRPSRRALEAEAAEAAFY